MTSAFSKLKNFFTYPAMRGIDMDLPESVSSVSMMIQKKSFLRKIYIKWYTELAASIPMNINGSVLELGSGAGFLKEFVPGLITSEILKIPGVDIIMDGHSLPFANSSLRAIVMVDVFHHLPCVESFLSEAGRCVKSGGVIAMVEPWCTTWSRFVYKYLHHEPFLPETNEWSFPAGGALSSANSALPWIVFKRDRDVFMNTFRQWEIKGISLHTPFSYLISGGLSMRSFLPARFYGVCSNIEKSLKPWRNQLSMFATIILVRKGSYPQ